MSKIDVKELKDLFGEKYKLTMAGKEIEVEPLGIKQMAKFSTFQEEKDITGAFEYVIRQTLLTGIEGITEEQINSIKQEILVEIIPQIMKGNGLEGDAEKKLEKSSP